MQNVLNRESPKFSPFISRYSTIRGMESTTNAKFVGETQLSKYLCGECIFQVKMGFSKYKATRRCIVRIQTLYKNEVIAA